MLTTLFSTTHKFSVAPNEVGLLYVKNKLSEVLEPGVYERRGKREDFALAGVPTRTFWTTVTNQEVLTRDNIALRFSYHIGYAIADAKLFATHYNVLETYFSAAVEANTLAAMYAQLYVRELIGNVHSGELSEQRATLLPAEVPASVQALLTPYGIRLEGIRLRDLTFPKSIQNLFAKKLEAQISAEVKLTDARASVAAARALKNAASLMTTDPNIRYIRLLETMSDMAKQGNHTFVLGEGLQSA